jgi:peptidoglycan/LPS O-acetylase OafA/YrhL
LDGLRALAIALVFAEHCHIPGFDAGFFGVDVFFVLSGFLITGLLVGEVDARGTIDLMGFYLRRFLRLGPALLLLLAAYLAIAPVIWPQYGLWPHFRDAALAGSYLSDYGRAFWGSPMILQHTWSLSVEAHFYFIWPFVILLLARVEPRWRLTALCGLYMLATAWRIHEYDSLGWQATYFSFDTRTSGLICGALLAIYLTRMNRISDKDANTYGVFACIALVSCLSLSYWRAPWSLVWLTPIAQLAAAGLLMSATVPKSWVSRVLSARPLVAIGTISYGIYLWHYPAALFFRSLLPWYEAVPVVLIFAVAVAGASYFFVERPLQRYRRNLNARPRQANAEPEPPRDGRVPRLAPENPVTAA